MTALIVTAGLLAVIRLAAGSWRGVAVLAVSLVVAFGVGAGIVTAHPEWTNGPAAPADVELEAVER